MRFMAISADETSRARKSAMLTISSEPGNLSVEKLKAIGGLLVLKRNEFQYQQHTYFCHTHEVLPLSAYQVFSSAVTRDAVALQ